MKTSKCLMGVLLSSVLIFSSVFAANALSKDGLVNKDGFDVKGVVTPVTVGEPSGNNNRDCTDCEFDFTAYGSECCDSAWDEFGINCADLEANYYWDCSGCACPGDGDPVCGDGSCNGDEDYMTCPEDCNEPGECDAGYIIDCADDDCCPESWIGDGFEDCEDQAYGCDLTCYDNDGGDCAPACPDGEVECWDGSCAASEGDCPEAPDCTSTFMIYGSDESIGPCYSDGSAYYSFVWEGGCLATYIEWTDETGYSNGMDISSYGFTEGFFFYGFNPGGSIVATMVFAGDASADGAADADCGGEDICGDGWCTGGETYENCPDDCNEPGECDAGYVTDCVDDDCCPESWIGDGFEDCEDQAYGCDLTCYDDDGGDCGPTESCEDQGLVTCADGSCAATAEDCPEPGECDDGYVTDCVDDDCCPESWIGDGLCDGEDQAWGCNLTCYDWDGGDCEEPCDNYTCWDGSCVDDMADCPDEPDVPEPTGVCIAGENYAGYPAVTVSWDIETACGDGVCNGDEDYDNCPEDCNEPGECDPGYVSDCADDDCCPESWIGDGFEDCEDQAYGCDLT